MLIGCPREIKNQEYRVGLTPESAKELVKHGHAVWIESGAGLGIGADDAQYRAAGAEIVEGPARIFAECELVVKVKEPQPAERAQLREGQVLYTYLHLAPDPEQTADLVKSGVTAIAYETVTGPGGTLPLLKPMSQVAGRMSIQAGANALEKAHGGREVEVGVEQLPGVELGALVRLRLLDLHHHLAFGEDRFRTRDDLRSGGLVLLVGGADAEAGAAFDPHLVAVLDELLGALGRQPDAVFLVLDLARTADQHGGPPLAATFVTSETGYAQSR